MRDNRMGQASFAGREETGARARKALSGIAFLPVQHIVACSLLVMAFGAAVRAQAATYPCGPARTSPARLQAWRRPGPASKD